MTGHQGGSSTIRVASQAFNQAERRQRRVCAENVLIRFSSLLFMAKRRQRRVCAEISWNLSSSLLFLAERRQRRVCAESVLILSNSPLFLAERRQRHCVLSVFLLSSSLLSLRRHRSGRLQRGPRSEQRQWHWSRTGARSCVFSAHLLHWV